MSQLKLLIGVAVAVLLAAGFLDGVPETIKQGVMWLFFLVVLGVILTGVHRMFLADREDDGEDAAENSSGDASTDAPQPFTMTQPEAASITSSQIIHYKPPWSVVEQGVSLGSFRHAPIPAWIRTSDQREADYIGVFNSSLPDGCVCVEIPERSELILPPGLVYAIRS